MHTLILPCAGRSTRFPISRPKWSLTHPYGEIMLIQSIKGLDLSKYNKIVAIFIKEDLENNLGLKEGIIKSFEALGLKYELVILDSRTKSQSETVYKGIKKLNIKGNILIKDCDSYFTCDYESNNFVYVSSLQNLGKINAKSKSYVDIDTNNFIKTIVEKNVIGNLFCCGGYNFSNTEEFLKTYEYLSQFNNNEEIYISHIIYQQILDGKQFNVKQTNNFKDWGTLEDWNEYKKQYKTLFLDIDGVLVENSGEYIGKIWGETQGIHPNVQYINNLYETGKVRIILTTSRKSSYKKETLNQLERENIKYHDIIFDLLHCQRVLVNDFSQTNSYPTSIGINLPRNDNNLKEYLKE